MISYASECECVFFLSIPFKNRFANMLFVWLNDAKIVLPQNVQNVVCWTNSSCKNIGYKMKE